MKSIIDAHVHLHYEVPVISLIEIRIPEKHEVLEAYEEFKKICKTYNVEKILGVFASPFEEANKEMIKDPFIYPGIYIDLTIGLEESVGGEDLEKYEFALLDIDDPSTIFVTSPIDEKYESEVEKVVDFLKNNGIEKIQVHTDGIDENHWKIIKKLLDKDIKLYLVSGVHSIYWKKKYFESKLNPQDLLSYENCLFLGTSPPGTLFRIPHEYLGEAVKDGLENLICFESNFILRRPKKYHSQNSEVCTFYEGPIDSVNDAIKDDNIFENIMGKNVREFMK